MQGKDGQRHRALCFFIFANAINLQKLWGEAAGRASDRLKDNRTELKLHAERERIEVSPLRQARSLNVKNDEDTKVQI